MGMFYNLNVAQESRRSATEDPILSQMRDRLRSFIRKEMETDPAHDLLHLDRVWENCLLLEDGPVNRTALLAAAYLHDVVNYPKTHRLSRFSSEHSAQKAIPFMKDLGMTEGAVSIAANAIRTHSFSSGKKPESLEGQILQDADRLDALGHVGLARLFTYSGFVGRPLYHETDPFAKRRTPDLNGSSIDHYLVKGTKLKGTMNTKKGRLEAKRRFQVAEAFISGFAKEIGAKYP